MSLSFFIAVSLCILETVSNPDSTIKEILISKALFNLTSNNQCTTNYALIDQYFSLLKEKNLQPSSPRRNRDQIDQIINRLNYYKVVEDLSSPVYKICPFKVSEDDRTPNINNTLVNLSMAHTFQKYPYLVKNLHPNRLTELINYLPLDLRVQFKILKYTILNHQLYVQSFPETLHITHEPDTMKRNVRPFLGQLPDMVYIVFTRDELHMRIFKDYLQNKNSNHSEMDGYCEIYKRVIVDLPAFMRSKDLHYQFQFNKLLIIDPFIFWGRWPGVVERVQKASKDYPWETKIQKSYWRGVFSGQSYQDVDTYSDIPRYFIRLHTVNLSNTYPDLIDHKPTGQDNIPKQIKQRLNISYEMSPNVNYQDHVKYKYLLSVDGWSAVWERIPWIMFSNSLLLKHETGKVQWFHHQMLPYVHYIPLKADLSDIAQQIKFIKEHDQLARNITLNANKFAQQRFYYDQLHRKLVSILKEYASYQKYQLGFFQKLNLKLNKPESLSQISETLNKLKIQIMSVVILFLVIIVGLSVYYKICMKRTKQIVKIQQLQQRDQNSFVNDGVIRQ